MNEWSRIEAFKVPTSDFHSIPNPGGRNTILEPHGIAGNAARVEVEFAARPETDGDVAPESRTFLRGSFWVISGVIRDSINSASEDY